jgi:tRNA modification GTPase
MDCVACLDKYFELSATGGDTVLVAQQVRKALRHIGKITGHVSTEQILDVIFKDFCVGK